MMAVVMRLDFLNMFFCFFFLASPYNILSMVLGKIGRHLDWPPKTNELVYQL